MSRFRGGLVFKAHILFHHSNLGSRVILLLLSLFFITLDLELSDTKVYEP